VVRRILLRATLFLVPASALWALLPLVASRRLGLGSGGYGLLLGALGVGAIAGASVLSKVRARVSPNALIELIGAVFAVSLVAVILVRSTPVVVIVLLPAGVAWVGMLATVNTVLQLFLPRWVRARGLSVYQMVLFGTQGFGALAWGALADAFGLTVAFLAAAGLMILGAVSVRGLAVGRHCEHGPAHGPSARSGCCAGSGTRLGTGRGTNGLHNCGRS
jgi:predicted MFS family arabinose efflux permease